MFQEIRNRTLGTMIAALVASAAVLCTSCGEETKDELPVGEVSAGWDAFEDGRYESALSSFQSAISKAPGWAEPYSGLGWSYAALGRFYSAEDSLARAEENFNLAEENFDLAIQRSPTFADAWAGRAIVQSALAGGLTGQPALDKYQDGGIAAYQGLKYGEENYVFRYDATVNARVLRIVLAECAFYLGDYATAEEQVELLDLQTILEPSDPDYVEQLLEAIGRLSRQ